MPTINMTLAEANAGTLSAAAKARLGDPKPSLTLLTALKIRAEDAAVCTTHAQ